MQLPSSVQSFLLNGAITAGHARALLGLNSREEQDLLAHQIVKENLTVRDVEKIVRVGVTIGKRGPNKGRTKSVSELEVERILEEHFSTTVSVSIGSRKGKIIIDFANEDDLTRIVKIIRS